MRVWTIANQKGGVGKTTTTISLGGLLASWGFRTLLIDMDPHGSLTSYFRYDPDTLQQSVYSLFQAAARQETPAVPPALHATGIAGLELLPAVMAMATLDRAAGKLEGGLGLVLRSALASVRERFDYVLIDCPPLLGVLMINALAACERLLIPVQTEFLACQGLARMRQTLDLVLKLRKDPLPVTVVPTLYDANLSTAQHMLATLREQYPTWIWRGTIPQDARLREASAAGIPPSVFDPRSPAVTAYNHLLRDLLKDSVNLARKGTS